LISFVKWRYAFLGNFGKKLFFSGIAIYISLFAYAIQEDFRMKNVKFYVLTSLISIILFSPVVIILLGAITNN